MQEKAYNAAVMAMKEPVFDVEKFKAVWGRVSAQSARSPQPKAVSATAPKKRKSMAVRFIPKM